MPISNEMRRLEVKWKMQTGWPKRLEWIEIKGLRGWEGQRFTLSFPIMAIVGENGAGKSTLLQCAGAVYRQPSRSGKKSRFASDFFPSTPWDNIGGVTIAFAGRQGDHSFIQSIRKPGERWRGNPERPERDVEWIDLSRIQPVPARVGYSRLAKSGNREVSSDPFDAPRLQRLSRIMGRDYELAKMALTDADKRRSVPVLAIEGSEYSGFHQGAGETTITELLEADFPPYGIVLIDEVETSLHPRAQRRLIRDLAAICRERELQVVLTTHSPYILDELPLEARAYIMTTSEGRSIVYGVSPDFAMTRMDDVAHFECDLYVEDEHAKTMLTEILAAHQRDSVRRCQIIPFGSAQVGQALGLMTLGDRFPRPSCVFLDGDQGNASGCFHLPGGDAPERVVFNSLRANNWLETPSRTGRDFSEFADACSDAMSHGDHHEWVKLAASRLVLGGEILWQAMCAEWASSCLEATEAARVVQPIADWLSGIRPQIPQR